MVFYIDITSGVKVGEALRSDPRRLLQAPAYSFSFSDGGKMGQKGLSMVKVAQG